ncbi:tape measure protein [Aliarcobacter butzleri]|uniref:tape measure protein n=1 Tax=Aliarcobacter butzleri TaxID=28197 RepID=UPI001EDD4925|nr:tape measure protein [Aliarcobacter butzleri]MCG3680246.1 tape measure protein [Aliarcobacter butzleri]
MAKDEVRIRIKIDAKSQELVLMKQQVQDLGKSFNNADSMASSFTKRILALGGGYLILNTLINSGKMFIKQADAMNLLDARLRLATNSTSEYESQQKKLLQVSLNSYTSLSDTITLFTKLNPALQKVGASTEQVNTMVATFTKGLQLGGATAEESSSAILQFSQAMGSGVLRGEEFNAMAEASPKLMEYLAKGLGVPQTALRKMAEEGELTSVRVTNALLAVKTDIERDFLTMPVTVGKAMTNLSTNMSLAIKEIDEATGASTLLSNTIIDFTRNISDDSESIISFYENAVSFINEHNEALDTTGTILKTVTAAYLGFAVTSGIATGIGAITTSIYALRTSLLVLQTSIPIIGWVAAAVGTAAGAYVLANDIMEESNNKAEISADRLKEKIKELEDRKASLAQNKFKDSNEKTINLEIEALQSKLKLQEKSQNNQLFYASNIIPTEKTAITELIGEYEGYVKTIDKIDEKTNRSDSSITKIMGTEYQKLNLEIEENIKKLKEAGATETEINKYRSDALKEFSEKNKKATTEQNKAYLDISKIGMSEYEKALLSITEQTKSWLEAGVKTNDALAAQSKLIDELNNKKVIDTAKEDLSYYERLVQLKSDSYEKEIELANIAYTQKALDIQGLNRPIEDKEKLLDLETQLYNKTLERVGIDNQINGLDEASNSYQDMLEAQIDLLDATNDWNSNLTGTAAALADVASATGKLSKLNLTNLKNEDKLRTEYEKNKLKFYDNEEELKKIDLKYTKDKATLDEKNISSTLIGYSNIAGALSSMYDEGSREAAAFQIAQSSLALVEGTRAILTAGTGDPYTAIPRMIAMGAMVSSLLSNIGIAFGMNSDTETHSGIGLVTENTGTGTVLGSNEASESISNSLNILEDFAQPQFQVLSEMSKNVKTIADNISGVARILVNNSDFALGGGFTETSWSKQAISLNNTITKMTMPLESFIDDMISKIPVIGNLAGLNNISSLVNKVLGSVFGKTSVKTKLVDSGYVFNDTLLTTAIEDGINSKAYQYVKIKKSKKSLFGSSSSTKYKTYYGSGLDDETSNQFSLILGNIYDSVITAGIALDNTKQETEKALENYIVKLGKISLKGKSQGQIQELLTNIFSAQSDNIAKTAFPLLNNFQQVGEGMFETLTRVATGMEEAGYYIKRLGQEYEDLKYTEIINKQGDVGFEALYQSITKFEEATYPVNNNLLLIVENLDATAEELYSIYVNLDELRDRLIYLGHEAQGLSSDMIMGAGSISELTDAFSSYFDNFLSDDEQLTYNTQQLIEKFNTLNIALPTSKDGFRALLSSIDLTTASGQELYGRIIVLNDAFASVANETAKSIEELNNISFESFISSVDKANDTFKSLKDTALSFINSFSSSSDLKDNLISYNKKRAEFESYFLSDGTLKDGADYDKVKSIYSDLSNVSKTLASNDDYLKNSLIDVFSNDINNFDFAQDVMKVKIVDGLGDLLSLNFEQVIALKDLFKNNSISKAELETLGLEKNQLDKILEYINNSSIISNNESLEKDRLSKQTLSYNDYVGQQEQVDIVKLLGVSYNTAKPLIENLQNLGQLDSSKLFSYVSDLVDFKTGSENYDLTTFSQIQSLNPYLSVDVSTILEDIKKQALLNKQLKLNSYAVGSTSIEYDQIAQIHKGEVIVPKNFSDGIREGNLMLGDNSSIVKELKNLIEISIQGFSEVKRMRKEVELKGVM